MGKHQPFFCLMNIVIWRAVSFVVVGLVVGVVVVVPVVVVVGVVVGVNVGVVPVRTLT